MSGAFLMSREIFGHEIWQDVAKFRIFFYIVGNAVFSDRGVTKGGIHIGRGQYLRSYRNIREDLLYVEKNAEKYYSLNTIKSKIDDLVKEGALEIEETKLGTLFTVVNYQHYQGFEAYKKDEIAEGQNSKRTPTEQQKNGNGTATEQHQNNKNYGIKVNQDITTTTQSGDPVDVIADRFCDLRLIHEGRESRPTVKDYEAIARIVARGIPLPQTIELLDQCFAEYRERQPNGAIKAFGYCEKYIGDQFDKVIAAKKAREEAQQMKPGTVHPFKVKQPKQDEHKYDYGF
ncbi:hypothetical protein OXB_2873 [Bacillus sp. OxB-1]|uniref:hypothetical protein n=1 Tax=Bacillus sp. (strain OxB-1) TaxID=98228 RepID=UPI000581E19D|nr:hypothetical protein [Bacillus sp. OxB-1]BAQ11344.1 hypothetical protein OXB_2873 [Bacillus sp. OxB-1]